jgi:hypothetical protein
VPIEIFSEKLSEELGNDSVDPIAFKDIFVIEAATGISNVSRLKIEEFNSKYE